MRATWQANIGQLTETMPERALATRIAVRPPSVARVRREKGHERAWVIANEMAKRMKQALFAQAKRAGAGRTGGTPAGRAWTQATRASAAGWMHRQGDNTAWARAFDAVVEVCARSATTAITAEHLARVVRGGEKALACMERVPPWLAAKVACEGPQTLLDEGVDAWWAWSVNTERAALGAASLGAGEAREALAHWRWPRCRPPLAMVALCHGTGAYESDSAWAHALRMNGRPAGRALARQARSGQLAQAAAKAREDEEGRGREVRAEVERTARTVLSPRALERARRAWARERILAGDGHLGNPQLMNDEYGRMAWAVPIEGPEALLAATVRTGLAPRVEVTLSHALTVHIDGATHWGEMRRRIGMSESRWKAMSGAVERVLGKEIAGKTMDEERQRAEGGQWTPSTG